jgi:hypothetical protein
MTSASFNARKAAAKAEMEAFDSLPSALQKAVANAPTSVRSSVVLAALLRGVSPERLIETLRAKKESQ